LNQAPACHFRATKVNEEHSFALTLRCCF